MAVKPAFEEKLGKIWDKMIEMAQQVHVNLEKGKKAFDDNDKGLADQVISADEPINTMEMELEEELISFIALEHPVATDLRKIVAALKIISHLERLGDHAVHWARATARKEKELPSVYRDHFDVMLVQVLKMLDEGIQAFMHLSSDQARTVASFDEVIDEENRKVIERLYSGEENLDTVSTSVILTMARYLERAGDHISHICEWIVYIVENNHVELG
jgi:phosphate transport system protein